MAIDEAKLNAFMGNFVHDMGAVAHAATIVIGDQLGLYKALARQPMTADELARDTQTDPRYVLEWASAQAASGYADYDSATGRFSLSPEQAVARAWAGTNSTRPCLPARSASSARVMRPTWSAAGFLHSRA